MLWLQYIYCKIISCTHSKRYDSNKNPQAQLQKPRPHKTDFQYFPPAMISNRLKIVNFINTKKSRITQPKRFNFKNQSVISTYHPLTNKRSISAALSSSQAIKKDHLICKLHDQILLYHYFMNSNLSLIVTL